MAAIAITGVAGFIGSHLAEKLISEGNNVIGIDNFDPFYSKSIKERNLSNLLNDKNFAFYDIDASSEDFTLALSNTEIDTVVHLSARAGVRPSLLFPQSYIRHDIEATVNVLETCRKLDIANMVFGSSSSVYGNIETLPYKEDIQIDKPISPYAAAKLSCEHFNHVFYSQYGLHITNLRFFTVYGPRQRPEMGIHKFTRLINNGNKIQMYGDGSTSRDYTYIDDIIDGVYKSILNNKGYETYNLGNNQPVKLKDLIDLIGVKLNKEVKLEILEMQPGDVNHTLSDNTKAQNQLDYKPKTSIDDGVTKFIEWYLTQN